MSSKPKLYYYKACGRANQIRLTLAAAGIEWEEEHAAAYPPTPDEAENWRRIGGNTTTNVPMLVMDGKPYCQSSAIIRAVARKGGLMPSSSGDEDDNDQQQYLLDKIIADAEDLRSEGYKSLPEFQASQEAQDAFVDKILPNRLDNFERQLSSSGGDWFVGCGSSSSSGCVTVADATAYDAIVVFGTNRVPGSMDRFPNLKAWATRFEALPGVAKYHASPRYESLWKFSSLSKK